MYKKYLFADTRLTRRGFLGAVTGAAGLVATSLTSCENAAQSSCAFPPSSSETGTFSKAIDLSRTQRVGATIPSFHFVHFMRPPSSELIYAYFIDNSGGVANEVGLATSVDGVNFDYIGKVLDRGTWWDAKQASFAHVIYAQGVYHMVYEGKAAVDDLNTVCWATSRDGMSWDKWGPIIRPSNSEGEELTELVSVAGPLGNADVGTPTLFYGNGLFHVLFHMTDKELCRVRIGYASGTELNKLTVKPEPVIDVDNDINGDEAGTVGWRSNIIKRGFWYYVAYEASSYPFSSCSSGNSSGLCQFEKANWGIGLARARFPSDPWNKWEQNLLIKNYTTGFGFDGPELLEIEDRLFLYFRVPNNDTYRVEVFGL